MALVPNLLEPGIDSKILTHSKYIQGSYIVVATEQEKDDLIPKNVIRDGVLVKEGIPGLQLGTLCYVSKTEKAYRYKHSKTLGFHWEEESFKGSEFFEDLKLKEDLKIYTDVGHYKNVPADTGVTVGVKGTSFKTAWDSIFGPEEDPADILSNPSISLSLSIQNPGPKEYGTAITDFTLTITRNEGSYKYYKNSSIDSPGIPWNNEVLELTVKYINNNDNNTYIYNSSENPDIFIKQSSSTNRQPVYKIDLTKTALQENGGYRAGMPNTVSIKVIQSYDDARNGSYSLLNRDVEAGRIEAGSVEETTNFSVSGIKYVYFGSSASDTVNGLINSENNKLTLQSKKSSVAGIYTFNPGEEFLWIAIPQDLSGINKITWNGSKQDLYDPLTGSGDYKLIDTIKAITLDTGVSLNYYFYQFIGKKTGSFEYVVS